MQVFDFGLQFTVVLVRDPSTEDDRQLIRPAEVAISIEESLSQFI